MTTDELRTLLAQSVGDGVPVQLEIITRNGDVMRALLDEVHVTVIRSTPVHHAPFRAPGTVLRLVGVAALAAAGACYGGTPVQGDDALRVSIDSARHVACYSFPVYGGQSIACVVLDSTNTRAVR